MSSNNSVIEFNNVWKKFRLYKERARSIKEILIKPKKFSFEEFWALRDVSFQIKKGETFGLIGENGSGKTTALKLLSRIYRPSKGDISYKGRISGIIELGAGFHPELTGAENIFLNGAILGLTRKQIREKFDDIVAFAELENFINSPVKNYSSGMYVRLGFSVAINVDPDILLIDEVLAVGDEHFQRKCIDKILEFKKRNKTIIIVSHVLDQQRSLCDKAAWLHHGELKKVGEAGKVIDSYLQQVNIDEGATEKKREKKIEKQYGYRRGSGEVQITSVTFHNGVGEEKRTFEINEPMTVKIKYRSNKKIIKPVFGIAIHRADGAHITGPNTKVADVDIPHIDGEGIVEYKIDKMNLLKGDYVFTAAIFDNSGLHPFDYHGEMYHFKILPGENKEIYGVVTLDGKWKIN